MSSLNLVFTPGGGGSGGFTHSYIGYNTVGGSWETIVTRRVFAKKVTLSSAGFLASIAAYVRQNTTDSSFGLRVAVYSDTSGAPDKLLGFTASGAIAQDLYLAPSIGVASAGQWVGIPVGLYLTAADYWLAIMVARDTGTSMDLAYDATGSDRFYTSGGTWFTNWNTIYTPTTSANAYSIRASFMS